ncbi:OmpA family protein [Palleronia sp. KMU-117]|uniref:OmpA family protein n=1 Tax=Palleronia sp. KMU-117 TaxID=3434108 RepID=UPI003D7295F1
MRAQARRIEHEEEEESAFVSMTDMTVGFLFIIMILLVFFASQVRTQDVVERSLYEATVRERDDLRAQIVELDARIVQLELEKADLVDVVARLETELRAALEEIARLEAELARLQEVDPLEAYLSEVAATRRQILLRLRDALRQDFPDLNVELSEESDALRFQGEGLFVSGQSRLAPDKREIVERLAQRLDETLPCFTIGPESGFDPSCNPRFVMIEAVQIEGHTDNIGTDELNRTLSTARANSTFFAMTRAADTLMEHRNLKGQPVLSVAAYGPDRPVADNDTPAGRATNRRIDLRFIMVTPPDTEGIEIIRQALGDLGDNDP